MCVRPASIPALPLSDEDMDRLADKLSEGDALEELKGCLARALGPEKLNGIHVSLMVTSRKGLTESCTPGRARVGSWQEQQDGGPSTVAVKISIPL